MGEGDLHDAKYEESRHDIPLATYWDPSTPDIRGHCLYNVSLYRSDEFIYDAVTNLAAICSVVLIVVFLILGFVFALYDNFVRRRNNAAVASAARSSAIVSSFFPTQVSSHTFGITQIRVTSF
jgi:hypothetical protein